MKVLVQSRGVVGKGMASPGVRSFHTARVLAEQLPEAEVTLSVPNQPDIESPHPRLKLEPYGGTRHGFRQMQDADVIVSRNFPPMVVPLFMEKKLALDFFTPFFIEWMELSKRIGRKGQRNMWVSSNRHYSDMQLTLADFVFCSNERQRDLWVGAMSSLGLVTPEVYEKDDLLEHLVSVIPYGVQSGSPRHKEQVLKGVIPGINPDDKVVIWNGLIVEWFDADTVVRAMAKVAEKRPDVKLFFLGTNHPDFVTSVDAPPVQRAMNIAKEFGIFDKNVFFNVGWVPYEDIGNYLTESDIGICAGYQNLESRYSFRTRFMDLFWSELPIVCTTGDVLADRIAKDPLGVAVAPGDADAMAAGILRLVEDKAFYDQCAGNMPAIKQELSWERTLQPLVDFCRDDEMWAVPKKDRMVPLLRRTAAYLAQKSLVPFARW